MAKFDDLGRKFSDAMCNSFSISFDQAVEACRAVTRQLQELHSQGMLHGRIGAAAIFIATDNSVKLLDRHGSPVPTSKELTGWRPAELSRLPNPDLPAEFDAAQRVLRDAGIKTAPYQVDLYAVGSLLCQFVTHELPSAYLRSPKIKGKVPAHLQAILQRALGSDGDAFYLNAQQLLDALDASWESAETYVPHDAETPIANDGVSVSSESRHSLDPGDRNRLTDFSQSISQPELPFSRLGHYEIQARIGGGGMGDVYRAFEPALDRTVAIKVLPPELAREADFIDRFHAEATAAAKLVHPNVVQIFYIGVEGKHHFFAMQFVPGESLAELLRRRERLEQSVALGIVEQLLAGLGAAHQLGLIHRDIKPGNILLDQHSQRALLADFGLVKSLDSTTTGKTTTGVVMGTVDYISPEQGRGLPVDGRSDLYSLGVLIYQMLSGRLPFEAASATAMIFQHVYDQPPDIRGLVPGIPEPLAGMIDRLLAKDPDQRYPTTAVLLQDLIAFRRGEPLPSDVGHIWATVSSGKTASTNGSGLSGELPDELLASLQPKGWWRPFRDRCRTIFRRHAPEFIAQLQHTQQQLDGAVALYERRVWTLNDDFQQGKLILSELEARLKAAEQLEKTNSDAQTAQLEDLQRHVSDQEQVTRDVELRLANARAQLLKLKNQCDLLQARLLAARARIGQGTKRSVARRLIQTFGIMACIVVVAVLPFLLIPGARESLFLALRPPANKAAAPGASKDGVATPRFRAVRPDLIELNGNPTCVAWSPVPNKVTQGHFAIGFEDGFVREYWLQNENSMREVVEFKVSDDAVTCMRYTSDGQKLAVTAKGNDHLQIWDVNRKQEYRRLNGLSKPSEEIRFSLNDEQVLATDLDGIRIWNVQSGQQVDFLGFSLLRSAANHFDVSRDGRDFLIGASLSGAESLAIWNSESRTETSVLPTDKGPTKNVAWLMNGKQCAALTRALKDPESHISVWERGSSKTIRRFGEKLRCADFSWDGTRVLTGGAGGQVTLWEVNTGQAVQSFSGHTQWIAGLALSQCGTRAVSISPDRTARIWKLPYPSNTEQIFEDADSEIESVTFSPNLDKLSFAAKNGGLFYHPRSSGRVAGEATGQSSISVVAWASDSQQSLFATGVSDSLKNEIVVNRSHATFRRLRGHRDRITAALFSVDSRRVISGSLDGTIRIWDTQKEAEIAQLNPGVGVLSLAVDPMGRPLCVSSGNEDFARIWDLEKRQEQLQLRGHSMIIKSVAFSRDGNRVITGSADSTIRIWETETGKHIHTLSGHTGSVNSVAVSRDGSFLVSGGDDRTVRQWDLSTGECVNVLEGHSQPVNCVAISHRQVFAASGSDDHTVRLWRISPVSPASKSRPAAESLDLLKGLDLAKAVMEGSWVRDATGLLSPTDAAGTIEVFGSGPSEYELTCDVERLSGDGPLSLGIVMQGQQGCIFLDAKDGMLGGLAVKKKSLRTTGVDSWNGTLLAPGRTHQISCQIRADQVTVHVDGRTIVDWTGQPASLMIPEGFHAPQQLALALATADKTRFRVSAIKLGQVADQSGFALKPSDSVAASLQRARTAQVNQSEFKNVIWDAAPALQPVPVMIDDEPFQWQHVSLATNGTGNGGIRFRSPLDKPGYLVWTFATTSGVTGWKFFTPSGTIPPSVSYHYEEQLDLPGLPLVPFNRVFLQHPASWHIRPDEECVIWFQFQDKRPVDLYCAVRLLPVGTGRTPVTRNEILQNLGLPLPLHYLDQTEPQVRRSEGNAPPIESWITAANGRWIAASEYYPWDDHPCHVRVYHSPSLEFLREIKLGQSNTVCLAGSPDSERIAVLTRDENCRIWEIKTGEQVAQFKMPVSGVNSMAFTADGQGIIACGQQLAICHARTGQILLQPAPEKQLQATALTITPNGRQAITGGADGVVVFWNLDKFEESSRMETGGAVSSLRVSPNGQLLAVNDALRPVVRVWDLRTQKQIQEFHGTETAMAGLDISQDGTRLLTGELKPRWSEETPGPELLLRRSTQDHRVRLWDIQTGKELLSIHGRRTHAPRVQFLASDAEVLTGSGDGYFRSWSLKLPQPVPPVLKGAPAHVFNDLAFPVSSLAVTADGQLALGGGGDVTAPNYPVQVWDLKDCRQIGHFDSHTSPVTGLTTDPSSDDVISASRDGAVFSWNAKTQVAETSRVHRPAQIVQYSHDGKSVLCGGETILEYRSLAALRDVWSMNFGRPGLLGLSQDGLGRQVFTCNKGDSGVRLWNVKSGRTEGVLQAHRSQVTCVAAASYGKVVVSGGDDGTVRVWDKVKRRQEHCFETESGPIHCVAVSNDGRRALSGGQDGLIRLWDLEQHFEIWQGKEHQGAIRSVAFTPDNHRALSGGIDQRVCIWDLPVPNPVNQAELTEKTVADWVLGHDGLLMLHIGGIDYGNWNKSYQLPVHMSYSIRGITLTATPVTSEVVSAWARLPQLERLELQKVSISPEAVQSLCQLTNLQSLAIVNSECDPASLSRLEVLKQLHSLQLVTAQIEQSGLEALARLTSLRKLSLRIQQLKASDIRVLQALDSLDELELTGLKGGEQHWISDLRKVFPETRIWTGDESD